MKAKEVRATFSFTKNLGNFQSIRVEATVVAELEPKDTPEKAFRECWALVKEQVDEQVALEKNRR
jgi:hypothetical protein